MGDIKLLDCTLRDGGFVNDWEFGHDTLISIFERLVSSGIDFIEIGFLDDRRPFNINYSIMPDTQSATAIYGHLNKGRATVLAMIDYGTCSIDHIQPRQDTFLDGIRVIFKKANIKGALDLCRQIKEKGYQVYVQPVSVTSYTDEEMLELIKMVNELKPFAISIVDTYGLLHKNDLIHYFHLLNEHVDEAINVGYHSHNNFQLGYSNAIELTEIPTNRTLVLDSSIYGMGKGAGNANTELLVMYMNDHFHKNYDINQILETIDVNIMKIFRQTPWGYSMVYYLAASNDCHPKYVMHLMSLQTLSIKSINEILASIIPAEKLTYNKAYIENLYLEYHQCTISDGSALAQLTLLMQGRPVLLVGPGRSINSHREAINDYIRACQPIVISVNFLPPDLPVDYLFLCNAKRYVQLANRLINPLPQTKVIATSNVTKTSGSFDYMLDYCKYIDPECIFIDNSLLMAFKLLQKVAVQILALAGFDGYSPDNLPNYYNPYMEYVFSNQQATVLNAYVGNVVEKLQGEIPVRFLTPSFYDHQRPEA